MYSSSDGPFVKRILEFIVAYQIALVVASLCLAWRHVREAKKFSDVLHFHIAHAVYSMVAFAANALLLFSSFKVEVLSCKSMSRMAVSTIPQTLLLIWICVIFFQHW